ncbi:hypothetical protein M1P56_10445 [Streptomyces sp. HU2014]|uniref:Uncharacterized protein n=1 Tax=Streptomyces albireticuli TaxID=1940 RepID=A0A1Z2LAD3_9ACTN|nr:MULTISPECIES: hypothetical protein [Streptomyces]ARZ71256.1 hypothetical protein SMD11_5677 [Streptomyces albireticuli]UQI44738.1 hypothetical protein M1P56_10445 [Streptomyces sp. HU2014]
MDQLKGHSDRKQGRGEGLEETARVRRAAPRETPETTNEEADPESHIIRGVD